MKKISIAVPVSDMPEKEYFLRRCLDSLWSQTFQDFEIVVTDNSDDNVLMDICNEYKTGIKFYKNPVKGMAQNTNEAIRSSKGELVKILYMDDYLAHNRALWNIANHFDGGWLVSGCTHILSDSLGVVGENFNNHYPSYAEDVIRGNNTIGSPSVLTIKNEHPLMFDESMTWLLDCDYYYRLHKEYGDPVILKHIDVVIGLHDGQATNTMGESRKLQEYEYINKKYE